MIFLAKKIIFLLLRARQEIVFYEAVPLNSREVLRVVHSGEENRGRDFIERLYGFIPESKIIGKRFLWSIPRQEQLNSIDCDLVLLESNRLCATKLRNEGFFAIPEWVEFGREVIPELKDRFSGAATSLKTDLKKIRTAGFEFDVSKKLSDFNEFYQEMYLPYVKKRFGASSIVKSRKELQRYFQKGFLFLLLHERKPVAGAIVKVERDQITESTLGVLDGSDCYLKQGVSGAIDYHLLDWAAQNHKSFINVGHTRPFPLDGVYRNKQKWLMSVIPDRDGVMTMGVKICRWDAGMADALKEYPFVFQGPKGLGVFCVHNGSEKAGLREVEKLSKRFATKGLADLVIISAAGFDEDAYQVCERSSGVKIHLFSRVEEAMEWLKI
jgi:hypothetical protein